LVVVEHHQPMVAIPLSLVRDFQHLPLLEEVKEDIQALMAVVAVLAEEAVLLEVIQEQVEQETLAHTLQ
jgi:hypothetical protein